MVYCGVAASQLPDKISPRVREITFNLGEYSKNDPKMFLGAEESRNDPNGTGSSEQFLFASSDVPKEDGLTCLVDKDAFVKNVRTVDVAKLCEGSAPEKIKITEAYLKALRSRLK